MFQIALHIGSTILNIKPSPCKDVRADAHDTEEEHSIDGGDHVQGDVPSGRVAIWDFAISAVLASVVIVFVNPSNGLISDVSEREAGDDHNDSYKHLHPVCFNCNTPAHWRRETIEVSLMLGKSGHRLIPDGDSESSRKNDLDEAPELPSEDENNLPKVEEISKAWESNLEVCGVESFISWFKNINWSFDGGANDVCRCNIRRDEHNKRAGLNKLNLLQFAVIEIFDNDLIEECIHHVERVGPVELVSQALH